MSIIVTRGVSLIYPHMRMEYISSALYYVFHPYQLRDILKWWLSLTH